MSIWNDPEISFEQFGTYLCDDKNRVSLQKIWKKKTKNKEFLSELENHELSDILASFQKECILSLNKNSNVKSDQLKDTSHLFSDWIFENKLSGIPSSDDEDYNSMKIIAIFNNNILFNWIKESTNPLKTYINSKNEHDPSLSQQEIAAKNKRITNKHPSLAHLFEQKFVNQKQKKFNDYNQKQKQTEEKFYDTKHDNANQNVHHLRESRAMLFFNHSDIGYETKQKCKIYKNSKLTKFLIQVSKGELFGGKAAENKDNDIIHIIEPIKGYIHSKYVKRFDLDSAQWKFLSHQRSQTSIASQSLTLRISKDDLFLPQDDDDDDNDDDNTKKKAKVQFKPYNENEDEKKLLEEENDNKNDNKNENKSIKDKYKDNANKILNICKSKRVAADVVKLWVAGFNLHDIEILKESYSPQVTSQQFVNQELMARDPILQCLKQMFDASNDVSIEIKNIIIKQDNVILEFVTVGNKKEDDNKSQISPTNSNTNSTNNSQNNNSQNNNSQNTNSNGHLLGSHPTKLGLPQKIINGVGIFNVNNGEIINQKLFWDQDQQWFSDMNVIKMPQTSTLTQFLYKNKLSPILNLSNEQLENGSLSNKSNDSTDNQPILNDNGINQQTLNGDNNIIYEMNDEMNEILALRGLNISDLKQYENRDRYMLHKNKQIAKAIFFIAVGAMFVFIAPKYLGKTKR